MKGFFLSHNGRLCYAQAGAPVVVRRETDQDMPGRLNAAVDAILEERDWDKVRNEASDKARVVILSLMEALKNMIEMEGVSHVADCPGDDTCDCPYVAQIEAAMKEASKYV